MTTATITEADVDGFRRKLEDWGDSLAQGEQAVLSMVLVRAFPPDSTTPSGNEAEVEGFAKVQPRPFTFTHLYDKASPVLMQFVGQPYDLPTPGDLGQGSNPGLGTQGSA